MEHNYKSSRTIPILLSHIERGSTEKEVQALVENVLWTVFPAADDWVNLTKYKQGATEPDNKTMKCIQFTAGWATVDLLMVEVKRLQEDISMKAFTRVAINLLDDYMRESSNPEGTTLYGAVGLGLHVVFFEKVIPRQNLKVLSTCERPLHWWDDADTIQSCFNWFKENIPNSPAPAPAAMAPVVVAPAAMASAAMASAAMAPVAMASAAMASAAIAPSVVTPAPAPGLAQEEVSTQYYYVQDQQYYFYDNGNSTSCARPDKAWVYNEKGWSETNRTQKWRYQSKKKPIYK